jgi:hypothetical protein
MKHPPGIGSKFILTGFKRDVEWIRIEITYLVVITRLRMTTIDIIILVHYQASTFSVHRQLTRLNCITPDHIFRLEKWYHCLGWRRS